jgi:hypothetical protein
MAASELDAGPSVAMIFVFLTMSAFDVRQNPWNEFRVL